jgi:L-alanine-DL-glutamate epimerase-like enolase superfamily enzyme
MPPLAAAYGGAEIDKAILDALLRATKLDVFTGLGCNVAGIDARLTQDLSDSEINGYLSSRQPRNSLFVRHTIGLLDPVDSIEPLVRSQGLRYFKVKLGGNPETDRLRLIDIARTLDALTPDYRITLDANEQYRDANALKALADALLHDEALVSVNQRLVYIEQPMPREASFDAPLGDVGKSFAVIIDEADDNYAAFPKAIALGYRGISSKSCKGIYKSLLNGARAARMTTFGTRAFVTGEDLTCQAGLAVQQDCALAALHGLVHCERNGHHYADGFAAAHPREADAFLKAHPDMYERSRGQARLRVTDGAIAIGSLARVPGFASGVDPVLVNSAPGAALPQATKEMVS